MRRMESIASYKNKRPANDEEATGMKRTASSSSLPGRASKKLKIGSGSSKGGFGARLADGLREEGWAEDGQEKRVRLRDVADKQVREAQKRPISKRKSSLGGRRKSIGVSTLHLSFRRY